MNRLSAVILARDEADMIGGCLKSLGFADEIVVVVDDRTKDQTAKIAEEAGARVFKHSFKNFAEAKNFAFDQAKYEWILSLDADERVPGSLAEEITQAIDDDSTEAFRIFWDSYFFAQKMRWGGWTEEHIRLFKSQAARYSGDIHEELVFSKPNPKILTLKHHVAHFSHRSILDNLRKTANYADVQAKEMLANGHPPVKAGTFFNVISKELFNRLIKNRGYKDGMPGIIEAVYQPFSLFSVYARLWELQQKPGIPERYQELEEKFDDSQH